jgi:hypothetical protein
LRTCLRLAFAAITISQTGADTCVSFFIQSFQYLKDHPHSFSCMCKHCIFISLSHFHSAAYLAPFHTACSFLTIFDILKKTI